MEQNSSKGENSHKTVYYAGSGLAIGAAIGMIFGLMCSRTWRGVALSALRWAW